MDDRPVEINRPPSMAAKMAAIWTTADAELAPEEVVAEAVADLAAWLYVQLEGPSHQARCDIIEEAIVGNGMGTWEDEIEDARNMQQYEREDDDG